MSRENLRELVNDAFKLNIEYYGALIDVTRNYLKALRGLANDASRDQRSPVTPQQPPAEPAGRPAAIAAPVPPLVLAVEPGKVAEAAFAVTNSTSKDVGADIEISAELRDAGVTAEPAGMMMAPGQQVVFKLVGRSGNRDASGSDIHGTVTVPGLGDKAIPVVLRHLPGRAATQAKPATAPARKAPAKQRTKAVPASKTAAKTTRKKTTAKPRPAKKAAPKARP